MRKSEYSSKEEFLDAIGMPPNMLGANCFSSPESYKRHIKRKLKHFDDAVTDKVADTTLGSFPNGGNKLYYSTFENDFELENIVQEIASY